MTSELNLIDVMALKHGLAQEVPTYARGTKRLDYILATPRIAAATQKCGVEPFNHRIFSDHRALFIDLDSEILFGHKQSPLASLTYRDIQAKDAASNTTYIDTLHAGLTNHRAFSRMSALKQTNIYQPNRLEALDRDATRLMLKTGKKCKQKRRAPWPPILDRARDKLAILKLAVGSSNLRMDFDTQIDRIQQRLDYDLDITASPPTRQDALTAAQH